jgi:hypothetical protein
MSANCVGPRKKCRLREMEFNIPFSRVQNMAPTKEMSGRFGGTCIVSAGKRNVIGIAQRIDFLAS